MNLIKTQKGPLKLESPKSKYKRSISLLVIVSFKYIFGLKVSLNSYGEKVKL